jgi:microcystin-dependent protein
MADPFVAEIRPFGFNFAPRGWAQCDGQLLPISQNTAPFSLLGTFYGGDGKTTFALPKLQGSAPMNQGQSNGTSDRVIGEAAGTPTVTVLESEIPLHTHSLNAVESTATARQPPDQMFAVGEAISFYQTSNQPNTTMNPGMLAPAGGSLPHNNMQPYLTLNFCIALQGVFPPRG